MKTLSDVCNYLETELNNHEYDMRAAERIALEAAINFLESQTHLVGIALDIIDKRGKEGFKDSDELINLVMRRNEYVKGFRDIK
jgi:hypothetical protein